MFLKSHSIVCTAVEPKKVQILKKFFEQIGYSDDREHDDDFSPKYNLLHAVISLTIYSELYRFKFNCIVFCIPQPNKMQ